jgi:hypothetical protein
MLLFPQKPVRHGRACPGHPRLASFEVRKTWMPGTRPGMTKNIESARSAKAALRDWQDTIALPTLCNPTEACHIAACRSMP